MPGIYIHIPFCKQACYYCNFHFSVSQKRRSDFIKALLLEIELHKDFFQPYKENPSQIDTIYFGGGTPSLLNYEELSQIFETLAKYYSWSPHAEITLEANPDDLSKEKILELKKLPINRLSIGIQSFFAEHLKYMNRAHNPEQAISALNYALEAGFKNITADLIYGIPGLTDSQWLENIKKLTQRNIPHISAYSLTVEKKTALDFFIKKGKAKSVDENQAAKQFDMLCETLIKNSYKHYEISNFAIENYFSKHNLSYWTNQWYLGLGPSAHSFKPGMRQWNLANTCEYIDAIFQEKIFYEKEFLNPDQEYNEYIMTSLRTMWGINKNTVLELFGEKRYAILMKNAKKHINIKHMIETPSHIILNNNSKFFADGIASDLFIVD